MDRVDLLMRDLLPASRCLHTPDASPDHTESSASVVHRRQRIDSAKLATTSEDIEKEAEASAETATPTKVLDVARKC
jgi:hypothetical protein